MALLGVSSRLLSSLPRLGTICSCFQLLSPCSSTIISVVHFRALSNSNPNSKHIPDSHLKLQQLLTQNKSGFKNLDNALSLFRKMLKMQPLPCDFHFCQLLTTLVKMKQYQVAFSLFREMCTLSIPVNIFTFNIAINCCCHSNRVNYAFSLLATTFKRGFVPDVVTYNTLIRGLLSQHKSAEARLFFANLIKFREIQPDVITFNTMIDGLCKTGHTDMALWLFRFMEKCNCEPNTITYTSIIDSLCKRGLVDDALNLHSRMMEKCILPDVWTYNRIIQVLCNLNRWEEVSMLLNWMMEDLKISPDVHTFTILVDAYSKSGKLDDAKHIIQIMNERGENPDIVTYTSLMQGYCSQGQMDEAMAMLNTIRSKKIMPTSYTYNILVNAYCREQKLDIAMDLYRNMASDGLSPTVVTHNILLHGLCQLGKSMEALTFFYKIQGLGHKPDIVTYETLLGGLCKNHYVDKALSLFRTIECNGLIPESNTYNIIIRGCLWSKKYDGACKLVDKMVDCGFSSDAATTSVLRHLLLSKAQDPTLVALYQKCLH
ncbi:Tetratricopeptide-like helical domain-containing protein [Heracleum sosnowskyi]|uniref:Tetratricopeptide-like helical domain-containing protein n=1 Tax=Heracleum sosnowskyi TaxID=360622 RepID=A0AAD8MVT1_9APIA|nr:Tetratricopeptide-like helical domain-containing protein [Heracleum sosnowskyi]